MISQYIFNFVVVNVIFFRKADKDAFQVGKISSKSLAQRAEHRKAPQPRAAPA